MLVIRIQLTDVFNELLDWNCFHIICRKKEIFRVAICLIHKTSGEKVFTLPLRSELPEAELVQHAVIRNLDKSDQF